jgi:hypothetical protein
LRASASAASSGSRLGRGGAGDADCEQHPIVAAQGTWGFAQRPLVERATPCDVKYWQPFIAPRFRRARERALCARDRGVGFLDAGLLELGDRLLGRRVEDLATAGLATLEQSLSLVAGDDLIEQALFDTAVVQVVVDDLVAERRTRNTSLLECADRIA